MGWLVNIKDAVADRVAVVCQRGAITSAVSTAGFSGAASAAQHSVGEPFVMIGGMGLSEWGILISAFCTLCLTVGTLVFKFLGYRQVQKAAREGRLVVQASGDE
jgi:uncharacterized membrane protein YccC